MSTVDIPDCITYSIGILLGDVTRDTEDQVIEIGEKTLCNSTHYLVYKDVRAKMKLLNKINSVILACNRYYHKSDWLWDETRDDVEYNKSELARYKKTIDEFVEWCKNERKIPNVHDWSH